MLFLEFTMTDALIFSFVAILMVFAILLILTGIIYLLKYVNKKPQAAPAASPAPAPAPAASDASELNRRIAILTASCHFKETHDGDVKVVSCRKIS